MHDKTGRDSSNIHHGQDETCHMTTCGGGGELLLIWPETHAGIPQQCLGWMKRRGAAPGCHEKGKREDN